MSKYKDEDEIKRLFEKVLRLIESSENKRRKEIWGGRFYPADYHPGLITPFPVRKRKEKKVPISVGWDRIVWSNMLDFNIKEYYTDPIVYLKETLKMNIYQFNNIPDDTPLEKNIPIFLGVGFEASLFGVPIVYSSDHEPLFTSEGAVIRHKKDLNKLKIPDFFRSGLMPLAHRFYEEINKLVPDDFTVSFPKWNRGPFGVACALRTMERLLIDVVEDPNFVHKIMRVINDSRKEYTHKRRKFTGKSEPAESVCLNDEVSVPMVSPQIYQDFIFPYEDELAKFYGGIMWWHSCGNKTPLVPIIKKMSQPIGFMDFRLCVDDLLTAVKSLDGKIPFHVRPGNADVLDRCEARVKNRFNGIMCMCKGANWALRLDDLQLVSPSEKDINTIKRYISVVREIGYISN